MSVVVAALIVLVAAAAVVLEVRAERDSSGAESRTAAHWSAAILGLASWVAIGWLPWQAAVGSPWIRTAVAVGWFLVPGVLAARVLRGGGEAAPLALPTGFAVSVTLASALGLLASLGHVSFRVTLVSFTVVGGALILMRGLGARAGSRAAPRTAGERAILCAGLLAVAVGARLAFDPGLSAADDLTEIARTLDYHRSAALSYQGHIVVDAGIIAPRYWLAFWPVALAQLAAVADLHPLVFDALYVGPFLAALALLAVYALCRRCGLSANVAWFAVAAHLACLVLLSETLSQPGGLFFRRTIEDKTVAVTIFTPVFLGLVAAALRNGGGSRWALAALAGLALTATHGVMLAFAVLIAAAAGAILLVPQRRWKRLATLLLLLAGITAPQAAMRFVDHPMTALIDRSSLDGPRSKPERAPAAPEDEETGATRKRSLLVVGDGRFYGIHPSRLLKVANLALLAAAVVALRRRRAGSALVAGYCAVLALAVIPYTGWILGRSLTFYQLLRLPWFAPYGLACAVLADAALARAALPAGRRAPLVAAAIAALTLTALALAWWRPAELLQRGVHPPPEWEREAFVIGPFEPPVAWADLVAVGDFLDRSGAPLVVMGDRSVNDLLPCVSSQTRLVTFRKVHQALVHGATDRDEVVRGRRDWLQATGLHPADAGERPAIFARRAVERLVLLGEPPWLASLLEVDPRAREVFRSGPLRVVAFADAPPAPPEQDG